MGDMTKTFQSDNGKMNIAKQIYVMKPAISTEPIRANPNMMSGRLSFMI